MRKDKRTALLLLFFVLLFFLTPVSYAITSSPVPTTKGKASPTPIRPSETPKTGINLNISPVYINLVTDPGKPISSQMRVQNNNNVREYLEFGFYKFVPNQTGSQPVISDIPDDDPFPSWVHFEENQFIVEPNEIKTIQFTISPPTDAALGYYYAIAVNRIQEDRGGNSNAVVSAAPAMSVLLEVRSPYAKREMQLVDFKTSKAVYEYLPTEFEIRLKNTGNIHVVPFGDIFIDWGNKKEVGILKANGAMGNVLPQTERIFKTQWTDGFIVQVPKDGNVKDETEPTDYITKWDFQKADKFRIGKYTAHLLLVYDNGQRDIPVEASVSFWVIPWKIIGVLSLVTLFTFVGIRRFIFNLISSIKKLSRKRR